MGIVFESSVHVAFHKHDCSHRIKFRIKINNTGLICPLLLSQNKICVL